MCHNPQDIYLDMCSLPDIRQLPGAAAAAGLLGGARSLTGLYSVDQFYPRWGRIKSLLPCCPL